MTPSDRQRVGRRLMEAQGYLELGLPSEALQSLRRIANPGDFAFPLHFLRGMALRELKRYEEALRDLEAAARLEPDDLRVFLMLGWCLKRTGDLERAIGVLRQAQEANPADALVQYNLACYCSLARRKAESLRWLRSALDKAPAMRQLIPQESDFEPLRGDPEFESLLAGPWVV